MWRRTGGRYGGWYPARPASPDQRSSSPSATSTPATGEPDLAAGSRHGYRLLWVLVVSNLMALLLQHLAAKLGVATGCDLATVTMRRLPRSGRSGYVVAMQGAMLATELAELLGVVVALRLLAPLSQRAAVASAAVIVVGVFLLTRGRCGCSGWTKPGPARRAGAGRTGPAGG
jgi:manganese transport protein